MVKWVQIPALGCDAGLYAPFNRALGIDPQVIIPAAERMAGCVEQVLAQAPPKFMLMGTSFGGRVALETALAAPKRMSGLVIIGSGPGPVADQAAGLRRSARVRGGEFENVVQEMADIISYLPGPRGSTTRGAFKAMSAKHGAETFALQSDAMAHRTDIWPLMKNITCPVLCLWGEQDQFSPADVGAKIAAAVLRGTSITLKDCGHFPTLEYPEACAAALRGWLGSLQT